MSPPPKKVVYMETPNKFDKKPWETPQLIIIEVEKIKQEEMENWLRMLNDPEVFRLIELSGPGRGR